MAVKWYGKKVSAKMRRAQITGINQTMAAAVTRAKRNHDWKNHTGVLEGSYGLAEPAHETGKGVRGVWGSRDVRYALAQELGAVIKPVRARALQFRTEAGNFVTVKQVRIPARPALRPAADIEYPKLADRIRIAFERDAA